MLQLYDMNFPFNNNAVTTPLNIIHLVTNDASQVLRDYMYRDDNDAEI